jgi:hypothetical protein
MVCLADCANLRVRIKTGGPTKSWSQAQRRRRALGISPGFIEYGVS